jgi:hypothetical protein
MGEWRCRWWFASSVWGHPVDWLKTCLLPLGVGFSTNSQSAGVLLRCGSKRREHFLHQECPLRLYLHL